MIYYSKINCIFKIKKEFDMSHNKEENILIINCDKCSFLSKNLKNQFFNTKCFNNLVKFFIQTQNIGEVTIKSGKKIFRLTSNQIDLFQDYAEFIIQIKSRVKSHNFRIKKECIKKDEC